MVQNFFRTFGLLDCRLEHHVYVNSQDIISRTPSHDTVWGRVDICEEDYLWIVRLLLEHGADVDAKDRGETTPWQLALEQQKGKIAQLLSACRSGGAQT